MAQLNFIGLFSLSHGGHGNQQGGVPFIVVWRHLHVAGQYFEEILQHP